MEEKREEDRRDPSISIGGNVEGPLTIGSGNTVVGSVSQGGSVIISGGPVSQVFSIQQQAFLSRVGTAEEVKTLAESFQMLDREIETEAPEEVQSEAKKQAGRLKSELVNEKPDLTILEQVKSWFIDNIPLLLGTVTGILTHPIVGKLVEAAGEYTLGYFRKRLGLSEAG